MRKILMLFIVINMLCIGSVASTSKNDPTININFKNLKIVDFVKMVAKITHKNILVDQKIKGTIDFISVKPIRRSQVYNLLVNILDTKGYSIRDTKMGFLKIIRNADAPRTAPPLLSKSNIAEVQTAIIPVKNINARNILRQVNFLLSRYGKIAISYESNSVIVTDYPSNIRSIKGVLTSLDKQRDTTVKFVKLYEANAKNVYPKIKQISSALFDKNVKTQKVEVTYDEATNSVILVGNRDNIYKLIPKIRRLDTIDNTIDKRMEIIYLKNANCIDVVKILQKLLSDKNFGKTTSAKKGGKKELNLPSISGKDKPTVTVDPELNAIIVFATGSEIEQIKKLIDKLDIERQQVYVVAKIFEISRNKAKAFGLKYGFSGGAITSDGVLGLIGGLGGDTSPINSMKTFLGNSFSIPNVKKAFALGVALDLYKNNGVANVVSEPTLLCINNKESSLYAGRTESVLTQENSNSNTNGGITKNYTREDIGLTLKVKPRISSDDKVVLDIKAVLEDVLSNKVIGLPTTTKREVKTTSIVKDGETVIIGGLVKTKDGKQNVKVPLLGNIPVFGSLFSHKQVENDKTDLVIMITPYIVKKSEDLQSIRELLGRIDSFSNIVAQTLDKKLKLQNGDFVEVVPKKIKQEGDRVYNPLPTRLDDGEDY
jgi:general secretion pathway protein D